MSVNAVSAQFPFTGSEGLVLYHPSPLERYFSVSPGIEVSVDPHEESDWSAPSSQEATSYNRQGQMNYSRKKGVLVDTYL